MGADERAVLGFDEIDGTQVALVGGKGAALAELSRIDGIRVPPGFCVTTSAARRASRADTETAIRHAIAELGDDLPYAVRSSATAEDSAGASFAGQHDSFLDVVGPDAIVEHVRRVWASLTSDRAL